MFAIHFVKAGIWDSIRERKGGKKVKLLSQTEAETTAERLLSEGASYVEIVQHESRRIHRQYGVIPTDE